MTRSSWSMEAATPPIQDSAARMALLTSADWCHRWNFLAESGAPPITGVMGDGNISTWEPGRGWYGESPEDVPGLGPNLDRNFIKLVFPSATAVTEVSFGWTPVTSFAGSPGWWLGRNGGYGGYTYILSGQTAVSALVDDTVTQLLVGFERGGPYVSPVADITHLRVTGTGTAPTFTTGESCDPEQAITSTPTPSLTPTLSPTPTSTEIICAGDAQMRSSDQNYDPLPNRDQCAFKPYISEMYINNGGTLIPVTPATPGGTMTPVVVNLSLSGASGISIYAEVENLTPTPDVASAWIEFNINGSVNNDFEIPYESTPFTFSTATYQADVVPYKLATPYVGAQVSIQTVQCEFKTNGIIKTSLAPIPNNPPRFPSGSITEILLGQENATYYKLVGSQRFTDYKGDIWYYIIRVEKFDQRGVNVRPEIEPGVWVQDERLDIIDSIPCNALPIATQYEFTNPSWNKFQNVQNPQFATWPIDLTAVCSATRDEIHALGYDEIPLGGINPNYPRNGTHNGIDLFVSDVNDINVYSMDEGLIVGIGIGNNGQGFNDITHSVWGAANNGGTVGYAVIIRHGHFYVVYGHLSSLDPQIWVGQDVSAGTRLGTLGKVGERHLHIQVQSYGESITDTLSSDAAKEIDYTGILPIGPSSFDIVAPFTYDLAQFLPNPSGYIPLTGQTFQLRDNVDTVLLTPVSSGSTDGSSPLQLNSSCLRMYFAMLPQQSSVIEEISTYRGFVWHHENTLQLPSASVITIAPTPTN